MKIYVAGPMRGYKDFNFPAFQAAAKALRDDGHEVFNPAEKDEEKNGPDTGKSETGEEGEIAAAKILNDAFEQPITESGRRKRTPVYSGVLMYFPDAIEAIARLSWAGNNKHNPGEPLHWARGKSTDHGDCAVRHLLTPDEIDPETGETHLTAAAWRVLALLQLQQEKLKGK